MNLGAFSVSLAVSDLERSRAFYEKFGFVNVREFTTRAPNFDMIADL